MADDNTFDGGDNSRSARAAGPPAKKDEDILEQARERYTACEDGWSTAKTEFLDDTRFARLSEQWAVTTMQQRKAAGRPCHVINRLPPFIRQVVNDGRQNRPSIKVRPVGDGADTQTAEVMSGLIRHIESSSDADVAYDTALDNACTGGFGFITVDTEYTSDDSFDLDLKIGTVLNPLSVSWDPDTQAANSSDWRYAFHSEMMDKSAFERRWPDAKSSVENQDGDAHLTAWFSDNQVMVSRYYERVETARSILQLSNGMVIDKESITDPLIEQLLETGVSVQRERDVRSMKIVLRLISGMDVLETRSWNGTIIPIVPVYGDSFTVEGRRYFRSIIHDAKDAQRIHNYSRSTASELVGLSPRQPYIGEEEIFDADPNKWASINTENWATVEYKKGGQRPQREPFTGLPAAAINEAQMALDDMKQIVGIHDAGLGQPGNEISGVAIRYRQHEGDVSTFHFIDNQHRAIRGVGRILLEMIPHVYTGQRITRIIGQDGKPTPVALAQGQTVGGQFTLPQPPDGFARVYDLTQGRYDLAVEAGPSYTTRREEAADMITEFIRAYPPAAPVLGPMVAKMSDWPEADKVTDLLVSMMPPAAKAIMTGQPAPPPGPPPEVAAKQAQAQAEMQLEQQKAAHQAQLDQQKAQQDAALNQQREAAKLQAMREEAAVKRRIQLEDAAHQRLLDQQKFQHEKDMERLRLTGDLINQPGIQHLPGNVLPGTNANV